MKYLQDHPLCERCLREGKAEGMLYGRATPAVDLHHKKPVESAKTIEEMRHLAFDWNNLEALCIACHIKTHKEMLSKGRVGHMQREADRHEQRMAHLKDKFILKA